MPASNDEQRENYTLRLGDAERRRAELAADLLGQSLAEFSREAIRERTFRVFGVTGRRFRDSVVEKAGVS